MDSLLVSIVIISYNYAEYLEEALLSAIGQEGCNFEVLVIDDCSTDASDVILTRYENHERVRVVRNPQNIGLAGNAQRGIELAYGEYIVVLAADDILLPGFLLAAIAFARTHPQLDLIYGQVFCIDANGVFFARHRVGGTPLFEYAGGSNEFANLLINGCYIVGPILVRKQTYQTRGPYLTQFHLSDYELLIRWAAQGAQFGYVPTPFAAMRFHTRNHGGFQNYVPNGKCGTELASIILQQCTLERREALDGYEPLIWQWLFNRFQSAVLHGFSDDGSLARVVESAHTRLIEVAQANKSLGTRLKLSIFSYVDNLDRLDKLQASIEGLQAQTYQDWHWFIIQPSGASLQPLCTRLDPLNRIRVLRLNEDVSFGAGMNAGIYVDSDTTILYLKMGSTLANQTSIADAIAQLGDTDNDVVAMCGADCSPSELGDFMFHRRAISKVKGFQNVGTQQESEIGLFERLKKLFSKV